MWFVINILVTILYYILGAVYVKEAIVSWNAGDYGVFATYFMAFVVDVTFMIKHILEKEKRND